MTFQTRYFKIFFLLCTVAVAGTTCVIYQNNNNCAINSFLMQSCLDNFCLSVKLGKN